MEKIGLCRCNGKPIIGRVEYEEAVLKVNEIINWINERDERERKWLEEINKGLHVRR